jgi:hypothetical protein
MISCEFLKVSQKYLRKEVCGSLYIEFNGGLTVVYTENVYRKPLEEGN